MKISEDKKTIYLDVPLGSTLYYYSTKCCDACMYEKLRQKGVFGCNTDSACHTIPNGVSSFEFSLANIAYVSQYFGTKIFSTAEEAEKKMMELCEKNRNILRNEGLDINEEGRLEGL